MQKDKNIGGNFVTNSLESSSSASADSGISLPAAAHDIAMPSFDSDSEAAIALRYSRPSKVPQDLTFEFTRDPALLHQYYELYERECRVVQSMKVAENQYNESGHILVVRRGNFCVGGGRLSIRTPRQNKPLPMELGDFRLSAYLPELEQKQMRYGEFSRLVLLPEFRGGDITMEMWRRFYRKCVALNLDIVFAAAPLPNLRAYRKNTVAIGLKDTKIHMNITLPPYPTYEDIKDYLLSIVIEKVAMKDDHWDLYKEQEISLQEEI